MKVTVMQGQSLVDIAMQVYGSAEGVFTLAKENGLSVTDEVSPGQVLTYDPGNVVEKSVSDYYDTNGGKLCGLVEGHMLIFSRLGILIFLSIHTFTDKEI